MAFTACKKDNDSPDSENPEVSDYRQAMRDFVQGISAYGKQLKSGFIIIPQNGLDLVSNNGESTGSPNTAYLDAIDANGIKIGFMAMMKIMLPRRWQKPRGCGVC